LVFVGSLGDTHQLAAVGLGNMVMMLLPYSIMIGVNTALETFVA
jgi:Na+-driven multidrug efflux pump